MTKSTWLRIVLFGIPAALFAQTLATPIAGVVLDDAGRLLAVPGVLSTILPGQPIALPQQEAASPVVSVSYAGSSIVVKLARKVISFDLTGAALFEQDAPAGPALFSFALDGALQWICFPDANLLQNYPFTTSVGMSGFAGLPVALGPSGTQSLSVLVWKDGQLWSETISTNTLAITGQQPLAGAAPGLFFEGGWLSAGNNGLIWQSTTSSIPPRTIALSEAVTTLQAAAPHLVAVNGHLLVNADLQILEIPSNRSARPKGNVLPPQENRR